MAFALVLPAQGFLERGLFFGTPGAAAPLDAVALDGGQHRGGLLAAHHADSRIRPHPQESRRVGAPAHAVIAGAEAAADDHGELGHLRTGHGGDHLRAIACNAFVLVFATDHEAADVLQKEQRNLALAAQFDEVRGLECRLRKEDAVIGDDADRHAVDARKAGDKRRAVAGLPFVEGRVVDDAGNDLAHVIGFAGVGRQHAIELARVVARLDRGGAHQLRGLLPVEIGHDAPRNRQCMRVVVGEPVDHARLACMHIAAAEVFRCDHFAGGGFHQWWPAQKDRALVANDDRLVAHRRHIGAACGA